MEEDLGDTFHHVAAAGRPWLPGAMTALLEPGRVIAGRYRLERVLAQGGMGCVWVGHHLQLDVGVAIKLMTPQLAASPEGRARFEREAKASAQLRIENAVHIYDFGIEDDSPFIVMELLEGEDLQARLARQQRLSPAALRSIVDQVCRGLRRAHEVGLVHRDLKPANIFLARQTGEETAKLLDFGIVKATTPAMGAGATRTGAILGSPHYMSPEQVRNTSKVDLRSDLWSLGVIVFRCLTGQLPFPGDEIGEVLVDVCVAPIPLASQLAPDLGPQVDRFFERALARDVAQRFQSAGELADAFAALAGEGGARAPLASPPSGPSAEGLATAATVAATPLHETAASGLGPSTVAGPAPVVAPPPAGTLSASAHTRNELVRPRGSGRSTGVVLACAVLALGVAIAAFVFLSGRDGERPAPPEPPRVVSPAPTPSASSTGGDAPEPSGSLDAAPSAAPSPSPLAPPSAPPAKSAPGRNRPGPTKKPDDLLNHI
jgi:hypothetical protein